jgi:histidinol-phosphate aminotransferase
VIDRPILLDRNENQYGPAPGCLDVLRETKLQELSLYSRDYERKVKSKLSQRLAEDLNLPEDCILLSYGSEDMLKQAIHCYLKPGEKILIPDFSWWYYKSVASEVDGQSIEYPIEERDNRFAHNINEIVKLLKIHQPKILLIASPNNPTGNSFPQEDLRALLKQAPETLVILDEAYKGFTDEEVDSTQLVNVSDTLLVLRTFSKLYALAGARIGYACAGKRLSRLTTFSTRYLGYNLLSEKLAMAALDSADYYDEVRRRTVAERERYQREFNGLQDWKTYDSDANFLLVKIPEESKASLKHWMQKRRIALKFFDEERLSSYVRITVGTEAQNDILLSAVKEFAELPNPVETILRR